jgi:hypothetical protein
VQTLNNLLTLNSKQDNLINYWFNNNSKPLSSYLLINNFFLYTLKSLKSPVSRFKSCSNLNFINTSNINIWDGFDVYFIKKDRLYTKLKYSRVTQYDISSGAIAALFAGFIGFLICEKYGMELIDSGDFYILFMYIVFICYLLRLVFKINNNTNNQINNSNLNSYSLYVIFIYFNNFTSLFINYFKFKYVK